MVDKRPIQDGSIKTILVPLDGSVRAEQALPTAELMAQQLGSTLLLVRVIPLVSPATFLAAQGAITSPEVYQQLSEDEERLAREYLDAQAGKLHVSGSQVRTLLARGEAATCLLALEEGERVDLVVMTTHGRTGLARFALGSIADRLVCHGIVPVLLLRSFGQECPAPALERLLVPLDGSTRAEAALDLALVLAGSLVRQLQLVRVVPTNTDAVVFGGRDAEVTSAAAGADVTADAQRYLESVAARYAAQLAARGCMCVTRALFGDVAGQIIDQAAQDCDLIIMATHGSSGAARWALGSVADRVVRGGTTPLLLIRSVAKGDNAGKGDGQ